MGWFWAEKKISTSIESAVDKFPHSNLDAKCPIDHSKFAQIQQEKQPGYSLDDGSLKKAPVSECPVKGGDEVFNPLNNMPMAISSERLPGQKVDLSTERTISTIPRGESDDHGLWEYPSPQQMLNAMVRKGKAKDIPEDAVQSMVDVHNFLNEGAWQQILDWEDQYTKETKIEPRLKKFTGRPNDLSPRAQMYLWLGKVFPDTFNTQPPFDRHDWTVLRSLGLNKGFKEVRYVIDYYSAPDDEETGMPSFMLDTRPALDSPASVRDRFVHWSYPLYKRAMGEFDEK